MKNTIIMAVLFGFGSSAFGSPQKKLFSYMDLSVGACKQQMGIKKVKEYREKVNDAFAKIQTVGDATDQYATLCKQYPRHTQDPDFIKRLQKTASELATAGHALDSLAPGITKDGDQLVQIEKTLGEPECAQKVDTAKLSVLGQIDSTKSYVEVQTDDCVRFINQK